MKLALIIELGRVALKEEKWLEVVPDLRVCPMFAEDISRVENTFEVMHLDELSSNGFADTMEGQRIMVLVQLCMRDSRTVHDRFVVTEDVTLVSKRNTEILKGVVLVQLGKLKVCCFPPKFVPRSGCQVPQHACSHGEPRNHTCSMARDDTIEALLD